MIASFHRMYHIAIRIFFVLALYSPMDHLAALDPFLSNINGLSGYSFKNSINEQSARFSDFMKKKRIAQRNQTGKNLIDIIHTNLEDFAILP